MRMNEVCRLTGLTDRTVRFWVEQGLLTPERRQLKERQYFQFTESDVQRLELVSRLRRAGFSIGQILLMQQDAALIGDTAATLCAEMTMRQEEARENAAALRTAVHCRTLEELADTLQSYCEARPLPEPELNFGRFDGVTEDEKRRSEEAGLQARERRARRKRLWTALAGGALLVALSIFGTLLAVGHWADAPKLTDSLPASWDTRLEQGAAPERELLLPADPSRTVPLYSGLDRITGLYTQVFQWGYDEAGQPLAAGTAGGTVAISSRAMGRTETELMLAFWEDAPQDGVWMPDPTAGPCCAVYYLHDPHQERWYELCAALEQGDREVFLPLLDSAFTVRLPSETGAAEERNS